MAYFSPSRPSAILSYPDARKSLKRPLNAFRGILPWVVVALFWHFSELSSDTVPPPLPLPDSSQTKSIFFFIPRMVHEEVSKDMRGEGWSVIG